jgi:hypothetical protein
MRLTIPIIAASVAFACVNAAPASSCFRHTFEPCQATPTDYKIGLDAKTGRTWLKSAPVQVEKTADNVVPAEQPPRLARIAEAAANELAPPSPWKARISVAP